MNLFPAPTERDQSYKVYLSSFKAASKIIDTAATNSTFNKQMRRIVEKFPYFDHTTAKTMAIAMTIATSSKTFDRIEAMRLIDLVFSSLKTKKDKELLLIDVARYWVRLESPT